MLKFRLVAQNSAEVTPDVLAALELASLFMGEVSPNKLPIDFECSREWYINNYVEETDRDDYRCEPQLVDDELTDRFSKSLLKMVRLRRDVLGEHYPFTVNDKDHLVTRDQEQFSAVSACYLSLQFFRGLAGGTIQIYDESYEIAEECKDRFNQKFREIFEFIAGYAVAGLKGGAPYMISYCRSAKRLEVILKIICQKVGSGRVRSFDEWNTQQQNSNDAGVDCLVHLGGPGAPGPSEIVVVGATVQDRGIDDKIIGQEKLHFFSSFFVQQPTAFRGALVRPMDEDEYTKDKCVNRQCLLFSYDEIWRGIGKRTDDGYQKSALRRMDAKVRNLMQTFLDAVFLDDFGESYELDQFWL